ncbi:MAG: metalloregulator ArsR/SmtB family transcription factor [Halieaceae bacterium]|jgi:ArsR family transcriptional regulator|nr:metalloregulator ArsR/SmtB family transcription factor [Halieaceae bacterium]
MLADQQAREGAHEPRPGSDRSAQNAIEAIASLCKASGDGLRLQILQLLHQDSLAVQELCALFDMRQPALSHHLKVMANAGLVTRRREGNSIYYRRAVPDATTEAGQLLASLLDSVDALPVSAQHAARLTELRAERVRSSREFFARNADKFRAQQDLIASYEQYADTVAETLESANLQQRRLALEVGPGDGAFLPQLSAGFERVVALDNAEEMLAQSRARAERLALDNIEFVHGDTRHSRLDRMQADCIVVNMVLHHTPSPASVLRDLARCLAPAGILLITDLCQHDQDWARDACGDLWLGFEPDELASWAAGAGLTETAGVYLAQRNGFQVQVRLFGHHLHALRNTA